MNWRKYKPWMVAAALIALLVFVFRYAIAQINSFPKIASGYPSSDKLSPHFSFAEVWWADALQGMTKWVAPGRPTNQVKLVAQACAWLELVREKEGGRPIIARCVGYSDLDTILFFVYPPAGSAWPITTAEILAACSVIGEGVLKSPPEKTTFSFTGPAGSLSGVPGVFLRFDSDELASQVGL